MGTKFLPNVTWTREPATAPTGGSQRPVVPRQTLNAVASTAERRQATIAGAGDVLRVIYGRDRVGAQIVNAITHSSYTYIVAVWAYGLCDAVESITAGDEPLPASVTVTTYLGAASQTAHAALVTAFAARGITYADTLNNVCYSVLRVPASVELQWLSLAAVVRGRLLYDPRENLLTYSNDYSQGVWQKTRISAASATAPDGGACWKLTCSGATDPFLARAYSVGAALGGLTFTWQIEAWTDAGQPTDAALFIYDASAGDVGTRSIVLTTTPTLFSISKTFGAAEADTSLTVRLDLKQSPSAGDYCYARYAQLNTGAVALDYTATTTAARSPQTTYKANPALALADFLSNSDYGMGRTVDLVSVAKAANACDALVSGAARRQIGLALDQRAPATSWRETLRTYAGCCVLPGDNGLRLVPDGVTAVSRSYDHASGQIRRLGPLRKRGLADAPTEVTVWWTDTSALPWRDRAVTVALPGFSGDPRPSEIRLPGIQSASQATREATERLNAVTTSDLSFDIEVFDESLDIEPGDVIAVTHPIGLDAKQMRVLTTSGESGRYTLSLAEYDAARYSNAVATEPTSPDTTLPSPADPQPLALNALVEEVFQQQDGTYSSRIRATWTADTQARTGYRYELRAGGVVVSAGTIGRAATTWASPPVQEGVSHTLDVWTVGVLGTESGAASASITPAGKGLVPGDVPSLSGFEVGGEVRLSWQPAVDLDIWRYEVRYGATAVTWADSMLLDRVDSLRFVTRDVPAGDWDFLVKAIDSVGQYSTTEARRSVTVTSDAAAILVGDVDLTTTTLSNMVSYTLGRLDTKTRYVTDDGVAWGTKFSSAMSSYTNPLMSYSTAASSITLPSASSGYDFGSSVSGNWSGEISASAVAGSITTKLGVSPDGSAWTDYTAMSAKTGGRYGRLQASAASGSVLLVEVPTANIRLDAVTRDESGSGTSSATLPTTITLSGDYSAVKSIVITPTGTAPRHAVVDNITTGDPTTFDVYIFDAAGTQTANAFLWAWKGV